MENAGRSNHFSNTRRTLAVLLFLAIAVTAWLSLHEALRQVGGESRHDAVFNPGFQHSERLKVAAARASMDVLGMNGAGSNAAEYRADYQRQRVQMQADSEGLERWAAHDARHQGLLMEIRASLAVLTIALDHASGTTAPTSGTANFPLLPALNRAESAFNNYSASLTEPHNLATRRYLFSGPVQLWWLLVLLMAEAAGLVWLVFSIGTNSGSGR